MSPAAIAQDQKCAAVRDMCIYLAHVVPDCELSRRYECIGILQSSLYSIKHLSLAFSVC